MTKRPYTRPITYSLMKVINLLDEIETDDDRDIEAIHRLEAAAYFHGRDGEGNVIPSPSEKEWKIIHYCLHGDCYSHRSLATIRKMIDDHLNDPEVRWEFQPGDKVVMVTHNPPQAPRGSVRMISHCEHVPQVVKNLASGGVRVIEAHDVAYLCDVDCYVPVKFHDIVRVIEDDPTGYVQRAYAGLWKMQDLLADTSYFKELKDDIDQIKSELAAAVGANAFHEARLRG